MSVWNGDYYALAAGNGVPPVSILYTHLIPAAWEDEASSNYKQSYLQLGLL